VALARRFLNYAGSGSSTSVRSIRNNGLRYCETMTWHMSLVGQKQTSRRHLGKSALPL